MVLFFTEFGIPWIKKWDFITKIDSVDIPTLQRVFWIRWWNNFSKNDIADLHDQINKKANEYFSQYQINSKEVSFFLSKSSFNPFDLLKDQIKSEHHNISEVDLMRRCMKYFKDQFQHSFGKDDSSMGSVKDSEDDLLADESQDPDEDINSDNMDEEQQLAEFWVSLNEDKRRRPRNKS